MLCHYLSLFKYIKLLGILWQPSKFTRYIRLFCCGHKSCHWGKKPQLACYHNIDHNTTYLQVCKRYSDFYSNSLLKICHNAVGNVACTCFTWICPLIHKEGKPHVQEPPSSVGITTNHLVCEQIQQVGYPLKALIY